MARRALRIPRGWLRCALCAAALCVVPSVDAGEAAADLLIFPTLHLESWPGAGDGRSPQLHYATSVFQTWSRDRLRFMTEFYFSDHERELERLQAGWQLNPRHTLWVGRFHAGIGYWNLRYHHGYHLQSTVHRPAIVEYEDDGGILPMHAAGLLFEGRRPRGDGQFAYSLSVGAGADFDRHLNPYALLKEDPGRHDLQTVARLSYRPDALGSTEGGVFGGYLPIVSAVAGVPSVEMWLGGAFWHQAWITNRITAAGFYAHNRFSGGGSAAFAAAYLQGEHELSRRWLIYGRIEGMLGAEDDPYLIRFEGFPVDQAIAGVRFDFTRRQALSLEVARTHTLGDDRWHVSTQWSAAFP